jgi:serine/threonine-protein kinase
VLLYHLLTGRQPYSITGRSLVEIERAIVEQITPRPSEAAPDARLRSMLSGDLDTIIAMAMRKEPERRYGSAADLEADLGRHLNGLPIRARPDTLWYRAAKWSRRHALPAASIAALALVSAAAGLDWWRDSRNVTPPEVAELCSRAEALLRADIRAAQPGEGLPKPLRDAIALWERATRLAPRHVPAWAGLAGAAEFAIDYDTARAGALRKTAGDAAQKAIELDPRNAAAYAVRGALKFRAREFAAAAAEFARSVEMDPRQPYVVADLADCLSLSGRPEEAIEAVERGLRDATAVQGTHGSNVRGQVILLNAAAGLYRTAGRFDLAQARVERAVQLQGNYAPTRLQLGMILDQKGDPRGAEREFRAAFAMRPGDQRCAAALGYLYGRQGRKARARRMIAHLEKLRREGIFVDGSLAVIHAGLGDHDQALDALEAAARAGEASLPYRLQDYRLAAILGSPRAADLARRMGLKIAR